MKKILLLLAICSPTIFLSSQTTKKSTYMVVRIDYGGYDKSAEKSFYKITAESGNPYGTEVYNLIEYNTDKKVVNSGGSYFSDRTDTTKIFYNNFKNLTEAFLFLSENNWELVSVYNQITSDYKTERVGGALYPYTTVSSYPVYFFRKVIE